MASSQVDGIAGAAIIALAFGLRRYLHSDSKLATWMFAAGIAAGITSLFQAAVGETMTYRAAHGASPASIRTLFGVLNNADAVKIACLAAMIGIRLRARPPRNLLPALARHRRPLVRTAARAQRPCLPSQQQRPLRNTGTDPARPPHLGRRLQRRRRPPQSSRHVDRGNRHRLTRNPILTKRGRTRRPLSRDTHRTGAQSQAAASSPQRGIWRCSSRPSR